MFTTAPWWVASSWGAQTAPLWRWKVQPQNYGVQTQDDAKPISTLTALLPAKRLGVARFGGGKLHTAIVFSTSGPFGHYSTSPLFQNPTECETVFDFGAIWPLQHKSPIPNSDRVVIGLGYSNSLFPEGTRGTWSSIC